MIQTSKQASILFYLIIFSPLKFISSCLFIIVSNIPLKKACAQKSMFYIKKEKNNKTDGRMKRDEMRGKIHTVQTGRIGAQHINHEDDYYGSCHGNPLPSPSASLSLSLSLSLHLSLPLSFSLFSLENPFKYIHTSGRAIKTDIRR